MKSERSYAGVLLCFFLSGFAALLYQTAWMREFSFVFGTSELAVATVLAGYMAGLSLGAAIAGRLAHRVRRPVWIYGLLELGIAVTALALPLAIQGVRAIAVWAFAQPEGPPAAGGVAVTLFTLTASFVILVIPTALMGATLPLLSRHAVQRDNQIGSRVGVLYAINTLGAIAGTVVAGFALLPALGLHQTVLVGVAVNAGVFVLAALLARGQESRVSAPSHRPTAFRWQRADWVLPLILMSGMVSFSYEVLWTRLLGQILGGSVYAFSTMLASFLAGITLGSALAARFARDPERSAVGFVWSQLFVAVFSLAAFHLVDRLPTWVVQWDVGRFAGLHPSDAVFGVLLLLPSTLAIGATFPFAVRITARGVEDAAAATARVYAWNTVGAIVGALGAGFLLIPTLGFAASLGIGVALNLALAAVASWVLSPRKWIGVVLAAGLGLASWFWAPQTPWNLLRFAPIARVVQPGELIFEEVGRSATVLVRRREGAYYVMNNGLAEAAVRPVWDPGADLTNRWLSSLPSMARPQAESLLVIGLGGGVVVEEVPASIREIDVIELEEAVIEANRVLASRRFADPLSDPRVRVIENDARGALTLTSKRYDAIVSQPSHPWTAGASHLYTREFFDLVKDHLEPGGVFVQWIGLAFVDQELLRVLVATLLDVFPHVRVYSPPSYAAVLFVASEQALPIEETVQEAIERSPETFKKIGIQVPEDVFISLELDEVGARAFSQGAPVSTDDANILQVRSPGVLGRALLRARSLDFLAPFDPVERIAPGLDLVYAWVRMQQNRPHHPRLERLRDAAVGREGAILDRWAAKNEGRGARLEALSELASGSGREGRRAQEVLALVLRPAILRAPRAVEASKLQVLREPFRAVVEGWSRQGRPRELEDLDARLGAVRPSDLLYPEATRMRARWRVVEGSPGRAREALDLLDGISLASNGNFSDFFLYARAAVRAGDTGLALSSYRNAAQAAQRSGSAARKRLREIQAQVARIPATGEDGLYRQEILLWIRDALEQSAPPLRR
ncbi:MAG: fused MFS/spermidine synthase [Myxococcota bacterium]|nr:fused MFS/spermidine synthase [Myxococcota bacterium]